MNPLKEALTRGLPHCLRACRRAPIPPLPAPARQTATLPGDAVKALAGPPGRIGGYVVRFGGPDEPDISGHWDWFSHSTEFWLDAWNRRPMLYHHAQDEGTEVVPRIGTWDAVKVDDAGIWLEGQLDLSHKYARAIQRMIAQGTLRLSSDSTPHLIRRKPHANGTHEVLRWPLIAASLTPTPAEPRLAPVQSLG